MKLPEPGLALTPEMLAAETRKWDWFIAGGVALFALLLAAFRDNHPVIPLHFASGRVIARDGLPKTDPFSFGAPAEQRWVNPSWLFDWASYVLHEGPEAYLPCLAKALAALGIALLLLTVRRPGPTMWWTAVCAFPALAVLAPRVYLGPEIFGLAIFAGVLALWRRADGRRAAPLYGIAALAALWANVDPSAFLAPGFLLLAALGSAVQLALPAGSNFGGRKPSAGWVAHAFIAAGCALGALAATPYGLATLTFPKDWFLNVLPQAVDAEKGFFGWVNAFTDGGAGPGLFSRVLKVALSWSDVFWLGLAAAAILTTVLNLRRVNVARLLLAAAALALPALAARYFAPSALVLAAVSALNGAEAFLDAFGAEARTARGWLFWSQAGRFVTLLGLFWGLLMGVLARFSAELSRGQNGLGIAEAFYFDEAAAEWLEKSGLQGRSFSPSAVRVPAQMAWLLPGRKYFLDTRWQLFAGRGADGAASPLEEYARLRNASTGVVAERLASGEMQGKAVEDADWKPALDKWGVTHVVFDPEQAANRRIMAWGQQVDRAAGRITKERVLRPLYVADRLAVFGRTDLPAGNADKAVVEKLRQRANALAFPAKEPGKDEPPTGLRDRPDPSEYASPLGFYDALYRWRFLRPAGLNRARTLLESQDEIPGSLLLAANEYRRALAQIPASPSAHVGLGRTYFDLYTAEAFWLDSVLAQQAAAVQKRVEAALPPAPQAATPAGAKAPAAAAPRGMLRRPEVQMTHPLRHHQIAANYYDALRSCRPEGLASYVLAEEPLLPDDYGAIAFYYLRNNHLDMGLDVLRSAAKAYDGPGLKENVEQAEKSVRANEEACEKYLAEMRKQTGASDEDLLAQQIQFAISRGLPLKATQLFEAASRTHPDYDAMRPQMARLYLELGMAAKAYDLLENLDERAFAAAPTDFAELKAYALLARGDYASARKALEEAALRLRTLRVVKMLDSAQALLGNGTLLLLPPPEARGQAKASGPLADRNEVFGELLPREGLVNLNLALLLIETGEAKAAAKAMQQALAVAPRMPLGAVAGLYSAHLPGFKMPAPRPAFVAELDEIALRPDGKPPTPAADPKPPAAPKPAAPAAAPKAGAPPDASAKPLPPAERKN